MIMISLSDRVRSAQDLMEMWGLIPSFLDDADPRPAKEQFNDRYISGWRAQEGFKRGDDMSLRYPGDPPMKPLAIMLFRGERIYLYPFGYICIVQPGEAFEVCRMD
jgi:hypothetical protein